MTGLQLILPTVSIARNADLRGVTGHEPGAIETAITVRPYTTPTVAMILLRERKDQDDRPSFCRSLPDSRYSKTGVVCYQRIPMLI